MGTRGSACGAGNHDRAYQSDRASELGSRDCTKGSNLSATIGARLPRIKYLDFMSSFKRLETCSLGFHDRQHHSVRDGADGPGGLKYDTTFSRVVANGLAEDGYDMREPQVIRFVLQSIFMKELGTLKSRGVELASEALLAIGANVAGLGENVKDTTARTINASLGGMFKGLTYMLDIRNHKNPTLARIGLRPHVLRSILELISRCLW